MTKVCKRTTRKAVSRKQTSSRKIEQMKNTTLRSTIGGNGNMYITMNQKDEWGRTTIIREIKKDKAQDFATMIASGGNITNTPPSITSCALSSSSQQLVPHKRQLVPHNVVDRPATVNLGLMFLSQMGGFLGMQK